MAFGGFAQPAHALRRVDRNSVSMEIKDGKINFGLRKPLLSSLHQPVSRLRETLGNTPTLKQKHGEVKLSWGIVFQRRALKPLARRALILLHSGTTPTQN